MAPRDDDVAAAPPMSRRFVARSRSHENYSLEPDDHRRQPLSVLDQIQALAAELDELWRYAETDPELRAEKRTLAQLRYRLAALTLHIAAADLDDAA